MSLFRQIAIDARAHLMGPLRRRRLKRLARDGAAPLNVPFYHRVATSHPNPWTIHPDQFRRHIDYLMDHLQPVDLATVQHRVEAGVNHHPTFTVTFDDGYADNMDDALPMLAERQIPTTYFVTSDHISTGRPFAHDVKAGQPLPVNTVGHVREICDAGIEIGLHTKRHVDFAKINTTAQVDDEIIGGKKDLEDMIGRPVRYFAVPFGMPPQITSAVVDAAHRAGLKGLCSAFGAYNLVGRDSYHIRRFHGDPQFGRFVNWLSFDPRKASAEPVVDVTPSVADEQQSNAESNLTLPLSTAIAPASLPPTALPQ
ncbi:polysaccharide deacetylase family protein [Crateriforma conspicua]|nr:polysaccharide deacetylase family protein [Crateriforma conspicua]